MGKGVRGLQGRENSMCTGPKHSHGGHLWGDGGLCGWHPKESTWEQGVGRWSQATKGPRSVCVSNWDLTWGTSLCPHCSEAAGEHPGARYCF